MNDKKRQEYAIYGVCLATLVGLCMWPIWGVRFLPMQDYPQHLFLSYVLSTFDDPAMNWAEHYTEHFELGPYALYYMAMRVFLLVADVETAGKLWVSAYFVLIGAYIATEAMRRAKLREPLPWLLLIMLPFGFNPSYFMGFQNFMLSIPILLFALRAHQDLACEAPTRRQALVLAAWLLPLLFIHPYTLLVFIVLASATALSQWRQPGFRRTLLIPMVILGVFLIWYLSQGTFRPEHSKGVPSRLQFWSPLENLSYVAMMFTGMQITEGPSMPPLVLWIVMAATVLLAMFQGPAVKRPLWKRIRIPQWHVLMCFAGVLILPFWLGYFSFFNVRLASIAYFLGALALSRVALAKWQAGLLVVGCALLLCLAVPQHQAVSEEVEELLPVLAVMEPNQRLLARYEHTGSPHLDPKFFFQLHAHEHFYYHLLVGGGASPRLFPSGMIPLRFRSDANLPLSPGPLKEVAESYRYLLLRDPASRDAKVGSVVRAHSGSWFLIDTKATF